MTDPVVPDLVLAVLRSADERPREPAITFGRRTLRYGELARRIRSVSAGLRDQGMRRGDRVLFSVRPGPAAVVLALGIVLAGGVVVFADPGAGEALFRSRTALAAPRWVAAESILHLASSRLLRPLARRRGLDLAPYGTLVPDARHIVAGPWLPGVPRGALPLRGLLRHHGARHGSDAESSPALEALVVFTSGTTDAPKAVVHTRGSLGAGLADFASATGIRPGQRVLTDQLMVGVPALIAGAHWILPPPGLDPGARPARYLRQLPRADALFVAPATLDAILRALDEEPALAPALELLILGGAPMLRPLLVRARSRFPGAAIRGIYGMTEILPVAIVDGDEKIAHDPSGGDVVGTVVPSVRARVEDGELVLSGPGLAMRYLGEPPLTELRTGDLARLDGDRLTLLGRAKEMFIRGTQNVYPALYEPVIEGLPGVAGAAMAAVPDEVGDDRIVLAVVPATDPPSGVSADHPLARAVARALPGLIDAGALPDRVVAVAELPRSGRGRKLDRARLAELVR